MFRYYDSLAGNQKEKFSTLSAIIEYIEQFPAIGESTGSVFFNETELIRYNSHTDGSLEWSAAN